MGTKKEPEHVVRAEFIALTERVDRVSAKEAEDVGRIRSQIDRIEDRTVINVQSIQVLGEVAARAHKKADQIRKDLDATVKAHGRLAATLANAVENIREELAQNDALFEEHEQKLDALKTVIEALGDAHNISMLNIQGALQAMSDVISDLTEKSMALRMQLNDAQRDLDARTRENEDLRSAVRALKDALAAQGQVVQDLCRRVEALES